MKAINDFLLVKRQTKSKTDSGFVIEDEAKGEGVVVKCVVIDTSIKMLENKTIYVPEYSLRLLSQEQEIWACSHESIIAYDD